MAATKAPLGRMRGFSVLYFLLNFNSCKMFAFVRTRLEET